jgi:hypothetical protein
MVPPGLICAFSALRTRLLQGPGGDVAKTGLYPVRELVPSAGRIKDRVTMMRRQSAATKLLEPIDGSQKIYSDDIATIHLRKAGAVHTPEPAVDLKVT